MEKAKLPPQTRCSGPVGRISNIRWMWVEKDALPPCDRRKLCGKGTQTIGGKGKRVRLEVERVRAMPGEI